MIRIRLERFLPYRLARIASAVSSDLRKVYGRSFEMTIPEWRTLATLGQFGETTASAIGAHAMLHKTKVSRAVVALEERRWVRRRENPEDRRVEYLSLTPAGEKAYASVAPRMLEFERALLARLGPRAAELDPLLSALEAALDLTDDAD